MSKKTLYEQALEAMLTAGKKGLSLAEIGEKIGTKPTHTRVLLKELKERGVIESRPVVYLIKQKA